MRKTILTAIILSAILFIACTRLPDTIPDDLEIDYSYHASYGGAGIEVKIDSQGSAILIESDSADDFFESDKSGLEQGFDLDEEELLGIYQEIVKNNFLAFASAMRTLTFLTEMFTQSGSRQMEESIK